MQSKVEYSLPSVSYHVFCGGFGLRFLSLESQGITRKNCAHPSVLEAFFMAK